MGKILRVVLIVVVALVAKISYDFKVWQMFETLPTHSDYSCQPLSPPSGMASCEDIELDVHTGRAYLGIGDLRFLLQLSPSSPNGIIHFLDLTSDTTELVPMPVTNWPADREFHPHGMSFLQHDGRKYLFVINHLQENWTETVDVFLVDGDKLVHQYTATHPMLRSINDLAGVTPTSFYITNDHFWAKRGETGKALLEDLLHMRKSNLVFCEQLNDKSGFDCRVAADGFEAVNSVALDPKDPSKLFVTSTLQEKVFVYRRDVATNQLTALYDIPLGSALDNVFVDADGAVWVASHPRLLKVFAALSGKGRSPSQVFKLEKRQLPSGAEEYVPREVYLNDGSEITMSSAAVAYGNKMLIGTVLDDHVLLCSHK